MTSERVTQANRRNAQASTGPRTAEGKERSRKNALKHGLTVQTSDLYTTAKNERLASLIAGELSADPLISESARVVAETHTHLQRVQAVKSALIQDGTPAAGAQANDTPDHRLWIDFLKKLERLERYERRAFTRRKTAIRHFNELASCTERPSSGQTAM
jgi:hypothetical protein